MKNRIFSNWKSSLLGIALLIICIILLFLKTITLSEFAAFFPTVASLLYVQDTVFTLNPQDL